MPETLDTLGAKLDALGTSIDKRFEQVDKRFDKMESRLGVKIEAVDVKASVAIERLDDLLKLHEANAAPHERFEKRPENHEVRLAVLENRGGREAPESGPSPSPSSRG
jgi:hypothetical protein